MQLTETDRAVFRAAIEYGPDLATVKRWLVEVADAAEGAPNGEHVDVPPMLGMFDPETEAAIRAYRARMSQHKAELSEVRKWQWERLVMPRNGTRRQRERVTAELHPSYWKQNVGSVRDQVCASINTGGGGLAPDEYHVFHGENGMLNPVAWRITYGKKGGKWRHIAYYCDAHLPAEYRPA